MDTQKTYCDDMSLVIYQQNSIILGIRRTHNELENGNYEKAIEYFIEYQKTYGDILPFKNAYCQYTDSLYINNDYISSLYYYRLSEELDNIMPDSVTSLINTIYECGLHFLENNEELLAFQYLPYSYMSTNQKPISSDFSEEYLLILGDFYINDEGSNTLTGEYKRIN